LLWMTKHGFVQQSGIILVCIGWISVSLGVWTNGGIQAPGFASNYLLVALGTSILLGRRAGIGIALLSALAGLGMVVANNSGVLPPPGEPRELFPMWLTHVATFLMAALLFDIGTRDVRTLIGQAKREFDERERAEREGKQKTEYLNAIGQIAIQIATANPDQDVYDLFAENIQSVLNPLAVSLSIYDRESRELVVKRIVTQPGILAIANNIFKGDLQKLRMPVSPEMLERIEKAPITISNSISEVTFGKIPEAVASTLQYVLNIGSLTGLSIFHGSQLLGTIFLFMPKNRPPVPVEIARTLSNLVSVAVQRKRAEAERETLIRELAAKNTELEQFTYTVSHDLKAPIITIKGFLGFLEKDIKEGKQDHVHSDVLRISEAVDKMNRLLNELLELSRIGRMMNPPVDVSFQSIVQEAVETVHGRLAKKNIVVKIAPDLPVVCGDRLRLVEVVQNLIDNAAKFMGDQPYPCIEIGTRGADKDGKPIFFVRDNGIGIEAQHYERVFGLFNKLDPLTEGTGVGLTLVKRIVEFHGGRIWIESGGAGRGTTFYFTLPTVQNLSFNENRSNH
jgi:signal transduction histidine kinase